MEWTDDMTVRVARGQSVNGLVLYLKRAGDRDTARREVLGVLTERFGLSFDDARLVLDRFAGGVVRAQSGNVANKPDPAKDPVAWTSYQLELGHQVRDDAVSASPEERAAALAHMENARLGGPTRGTTDVAVALEVARLAVEADEPGPTLFHLLLEAATSLSVAAEACIDRIGQRPCAPAGSQEWVDAMALASAARQITARFAAQPDPQLEERGLGLVGRIVTRLQGQCHAFVGRAMLESARCIQRNGDPERAASFARPVLADFEVLLDQFADGAPFDEHVIALEYLFAAAELITEVEGHSPEVDALRIRTEEVLQRSEF